MARVALVVLLSFVAGSIAAQENARDVPPGREVRETKLLSPGQTDVWKLEVAADEMLWCTVESADFDPVLEVVDAGGEVLAENDGRGTRSELWLRAPAAGAISLRVRPYLGSGGGHYSFFLQRFRTEPIDANGAASAEFGREQWLHYRVRLAEGDVLVPTVRGNGRLTAVLDPERQPVVGLLGGYVAANDGDHFLRLEGPEGGRVHVETQLARRRVLEVDRVVDEMVGRFGFDLWRVQLRAGTAITFDLRMPAARLEVQIVDPCPDEHGPRFVFPGHLDKGGRLLRYVFVRRDGELEIRIRNGHDRAAAYRLASSDAVEELAIGAIRSGRVAIGEGVLQRFTAPSGQLLRAALCSTDFDARLDVWGPGGDVFASIDDAGPLERDAIHTFLVRHPGRYHLLAHSGGGAGSGAFELSLEPVAIAEIRAGESLRLQLGPHGTGHAHLELAAGEEIWLSVRSDAFDAGLAIIDPTGDDSFRCEGGGTGGNVLVAYRATRAGRHTLLVHSRDHGGDCELRALTP